MERRVQGSAVSTLLVAVRMGGGACRRGTPACAHAPCWSVVREGFLEDMSELRPEDGQELPRVHWGRWGMRLTNTAFILKALL